jgi:hypothetical protein
MTIKELYSLYYIEQEIKEYELKIVELKELATNISPNYTGMPATKKVSDKVGNAVTAIVEYTQMLEKAIQEKIEQSIKINAYILNVEDAQLRQIMYLRFVKRLSWQTVANRIGGGNTADGVRMRCNRYVKNNNKKSGSFCSPKKHYTMNMEA